MTNSQRAQNPDVNSYNPDADPGENSEFPNDGSNNVERTKDDDVIPVPDSTPAAPVEEPPSREGAPVGDVDDSPKRIA
ncbi:MAG: hypothetical protein ABI646_02915 [Acidobacteriota bacterium]